MKIDQLSFWGKVRKGKDRGKKLGFPTANIPLHKHIPEGIYISKTKINGVWHPSLTFIGAAKTFGENRVQAETYLLDFDESIYRCMITIRLLKKIRGNKKFSSAAKLVEQMKKDEKEAKKYFKNLHQLYTPGVV